MMSERGESTLIGYMYAPVATACFVILIACCEWSCTVSFTLEDMFSGGWELRLKSEAGRRGVSYTRVSGDRHDVNPQEMYKDIT